MKLKHAKVIVKSVGDIKKDWSKAMKGKKTGSPKANEIVLTNLDTLAKIFSKSRMEILKAVASHEVKSIYELAKLVERDFKNVHSDVKLLSEVGLIELKKAEDSRGGLQPVARFSGIDFDWVA